MKYITKSYTLSNNYQSLGKWLHKYTLDGKNVVTIRIDNSTNICRVYMGSVGAVEFSSFEEADKYVETKLKEQGYELLPEKLEILL
jgi:hypothetical protein